MEIRDNSEDKISVKKVKNMLNNLQNIKTALNLNLEVIKNKRLISSRCGKIWEILCDTETKRLRGYGKLPDGLSEYLDCRIHDLINSIEQITEIVSGKNDKRKIRDGK